MTIHRFIHISSDGVIIKESFHIKKETALKQLEDTLDNLENSKVLVPNESLLFLQKNKYESDIVQQHTSYLRKVTVELCNTPLGVVGYTGHRLESLCVEAINVGGEALCGSDKVYLSEDGENLKVQIKLMSENAQIPVYSTLGAAGCDIYASEDFTLPAMSTTAKVSEDALSTVISNLKQLNETQKQQEQDKLNGVHIIVISGDIENNKSNEELQAELLAESLKTLIETATYSTNVGRAHVKSGIAVGIPIGSNIEMEMRGRSGLAFKQGTDSFNGTLDEDYKEELNILMYNYTDKPIEFKKGERVCQAIFKRVIQVEFKQVDEINQEVIENTARLSNTSIRKVERVGGLGHTGN